MWLINMPTINDQTIIQVITFFIPFLFSLCFHEYAHGWMAKKMGDNTAEIMGRLTMNPMAHIDWLGTVILPIAAIIMPGMLLFGWAKPVPVNSRNFDKPRQQMFWVALAGPLSNVLLFVCGLLTWLILRKQNMFEVTQPMMEMMRVFLSLNLFLAFFNLLPVHPLDGGKVLARFLPLKWDLWLEDKQDVTQILLMLLVIFGVLQVLAIPVYWVLQISLGLVESI